MRYLVILIITIFSFLIAGCKSSSAGSLFSDSSGAISNFAGGGSGTGGAAAMTIGHNPEPSSLVLLGIGLGGLVVARLRKKKKS